MFDTHIPVRPADVVEPVNCDEALRQKHVDDASIVQSLMLTSMSMKLQRLHVKMISYEILDHLKSPFDSQSKSLEFDLIKELSRCRLDEGGNVPEHVLKVWVKRLATVGIKFENHVLSFSFSNHFHIHIPRSL